MALACDLQIQARSCFFFFFLFFVSAIDQHDILNCINGLLYDDKITG